MVRSDCRYTCEQDASYVLEVPSVKNFRASSQELNLESSQLSERICESNRTLAISLERPNSSKLLKISLLGSALSIRSISQIQASLADA